MEQITTKQRTLWVFFGLFALFIAPAWGQVKKIEGEILDTDNTPLVGSTIQLKGGKEYAIADENGVFALVTDKPFPITLAINFAGYQTKELTIEALPKDKLQIQMTISGNLDELVIVGYGSVAQKNLIGSVVKVDPATVKTIPEASFDTQMQGNVAGVQIGGGTGIPGGNTFIRVRGATSINSSNDPLYIVDGVFVNNTSLQNVAADRTTSPLADLNPNDIETIEVLKDAAAVAIYGSRGANGVIIITTKRGKFNQAAKVDLDISGGWGWAPRERRWKLTTGPQHARLVEEYRANEGLAPVFTAQGRGLPESQPTYDRLSILNQTAVYQNYNVSISGGSNQTSYYIGAGHTKQEGVWKPMAFERSSFKVNIDQKINDIISIGTSNTLSRSNRDIGRAVGNGGSGALYQATVDIPTYLPIFDENNRPLRWVNFDNVQTLTKKPYSFSTSTHYIGSIYAEAKLLPNLTFRSSFSLDYNLYEEDEYWTTETLRGLANNGEAISSLTKSDFWVNEQTLNYRTTFGSGHSLGVLAGNTVQSSNISNTTAQGTNFPNNSFTLISAAANQTASEAWGKNTLVSAFSRIDYRYKDKYLFEASVRADGSSKFSPGNRWGYFPAVGAAWVLSQEAFLKNHSLISNLKLRANYGIAGNQNGIKDFAYQGLWTAGASYPDRGTAEMPGTRPSQLGSSALTWEKTSQVNAGIDLGLFNNRLNIEFNVYSKYTTNLLLEVAVPRYTGFTSNLGNLGEISNKGFELSINSVNIETKDFTWNTAFNISQNKNRIEALPNPMSFESRQFIRIEQGSALYSYWLYNSLGVNPQTGDLIIEDVNKDGKITSDDRKVVGNAWPKFFGGLTNRFKYKNFDLNVLFTFSYGNKLWNHNRMLGEHGGRLDGNRVLFASQLDRWQKPGDITDVPRLALNNYALQEVSRFFEDASFIRLRTLSLGYTVPSNITSRLKIKQLRLYVTGTNLLLFTKYTGADPETRIERDQSQNIQGYDFASPPTPRSVQFGLNVTF